MVGLKENVIIGRLIPAGTGFAGSKKHADIRDIVTERDSKRAAIMEAQMAEQEALRAVPQE
jgi:hypothetical protein